MTGHSSDRRLLLVHAHPDDETITTGGTIAHYVAQGVSVLVVTCTLGEEGEVIGDRHARLVATMPDGTPGADQLGGYRITELTEALTRLAPNGELAPHFLGGEGRWRDSGMAGSAAAENPRAFINADDAIPALSAVIAEFKPQVVVGYDPVGSYGHPDHIQVHAICGAAVEHARRNWSVSKHYWAVTEESALRDGLAEAADRVPDGWRMPLPGELPSHADVEVTTEIDVREVLDRKVAALRAHATQLTVAPSGTEYALSNNIIQPIFDHEHFMLIRADGTPARLDVRESDLFAGLP